MMIRMYAWTVLDRLHVAAATVEEDSRGREIVRGIGSASVAVPRHVLAQRLDLAEFAAHTLIELTGGLSPRDLDLRHEDVDSTLWAGTLAPELGE